MTRMSAIATIAKEMRNRLLRTNIIPILILAAIVMADTGGREEPAVRQTVESFYEAFKTHSFDKVESFTTEDWNHINPYKGRTRGREATLRELKDVHSTFLKGVSDRIEDMDVRFAGADAAVVTVTSRMTTFRTPDGIEHENEKHIRTFVVVKRKGQWAIMQDQNTVVANGPTQKP
jgi:uncharacterized protein (TIGR02246 family)